MNGKISITSPIGTALIGAKIGMTVAISTPAGKKSYKVIEIK
jgi:transcription elongation GreA/GreB family factor